MNGNYPHMLLVVMTNKAKSDLARLEWNEGELVEEFESAMGGIRLYNWRPRAGSLTIALPVKRGAGALLLKRHKDGDHYFCCVGVESFGAPVQLKDGGDICHNLPRGRVKLVEGWDAGRYLSDALDCDEIEREVGSKKAWRPFVGGGVEDRKWGAYLRLYEAACEKRKVAGLPALVVPNVGGAKMAVDLDLDGITPEVDEKEVEEKIRGASRELFKFTLSPLIDDGKNARKAPKLGNLLGVKKQNGRLRLTFKLDADFRQSLESEASVRQFYAEEVQSPNEETGVPADAAVSLKSGEAPEGARMRRFYEPGATRVHAFSCRAEKDGDSWVFAPGSVVPARLHLHADFIGDFSQIHIMKNGLRQIRQHPIWGVLTEERVAKLPDGEKEVEFADDCRLNDGQKDAVCKALRAEELLLIWGPPGTGKTEVIAEIARQEAKRDGKTLIVSQANLAVDNAIARLHDAPGVWPLRIAKDDWTPEEDDKSKVPMMDTAGEFFLRWIKRRLTDSRKENAGENVAALRKEFQKRLGEIKRGGAGQIPRAFPQMAALYRRRLNVVGATLMESGKTVKREKGEYEEQRGGPPKPAYKLSGATGIQEFSTVIVDEVSKAMPPELFLPVPLGKRLILVGDHRQLPPVIKDPVSGEDRSLEEWAKEAGIPEKELNMEPTLFERLWEKHKGEHTGDIRAMLTTQYRMHPDIQRLIEPFYTDHHEGRLECGLDENEQRKLSVASDGFFAGRHVAWIRVDKNNREEPEGTSYLNRAEVRIVGSLLEALPARKKMSVGVITFYGAQLRALCDKYDNQQFRKKFPGGLIFGTVDRFQGRECDVIICSLVRNNNDKGGDIGFASKPNRINVAFSRARGLLCIVGSVGTFCYGEGRKRAREIYRSAYIACEKANGCVSESEIREKFGLDELRRKWGGRAR